VRRLYAILLITALSLCFVLIAQAQEEPPETDLLGRMAELVERAEAAADRAEAAQEGSIDAVDLALGMFGLFEGVTGVVGIVLPVLVVVAGFLGLRRLETAGAELREARERFEREVKEREAELDRLRDELLANAQKLRDDGARASLALSLMPVAERQYRAQDYKGALDAYQRALELDPNNPIIHYRLGYVYTQSGELEKAEEHLTRSLELDAEFVPAMAARGYVFRRLGDQMTPGIERDMVYNQAESNFLTALNASPRLIDEDNESWWGSLGGLYRRRGQVDQAIYAYERCAEVTPQSSYPFSNLALLYMQRGDRERMIETYRTVEKLAQREVMADVDNYWGYADLIVSRLALGKAKETEAILETALSTAPVDSPYTLEMLLDTLDRLQKMLDAQDRPAIERVMAYVRHFQAQRQDQLNVDM
jgi:tetratricopeptide (TPR) repeat protein